MEANKLEPYKEGAARESKTKAVLLNMNVRGTLLM